MKYEFIENNQTIDKNYIKKLNDLYENNPNFEMCIGLSSTKGLSSELLSKLPKKLYIRVSGGYDNERVVRNANKKYADGETGKIYISSVIYTRNELINIVKEFEKIESKIQSKWSPIQKIIYIYDKLKREIIYLPHDDTKTSKEKSSLRGIVTKQTICTGYAIIFKELMDRNNIDCEYVEGYVDKEHNESHAWNIINLEGKKYPIDIVKDNAWFRAGRTQAFTSFTEDVTTFANSHFPYKSEKTQNYLETLSQFDQNIISQIINEFDKQREFNGTTYQGQRKDGTKFILTDIGNTIINNTPYFRYCYEELLPNGQRQSPIILYSDDNIMSIIYDKIYDRKIPDGLEDAINNVLFSKANIIDSITKKTLYLGKVGKTNTKGEIEFVKSHQEIIKPANITASFPISTKILKRKDGSTLTIQKTTKEPSNINGIILYEYDIIETIKKNNQSIVKRNTIYTEKNIFNKDQLNLADEYLSRARIDTLSEELGGYLGYYDQDGKIKYHQELLTYFKTIGNINHNIPHNKTK